MKLQLLHAQLHSTGRAKYMNSSPLNNLDINFNNYRELLYKILHIS